MKNYYYLPCLYYKQLSHMHNLKFVELLQIQLEDQ